MPAQSIDIPINKIDVRSLGPLDPEDLWPVTASMRPDDDGYSRQDIDLIRTEEGTFAALGINGGINNGGDGNRIKGTRDPAKAHSRRIAIARAVVARTSPFYAAHEFTSGIRNLRDLERQMAAHKERELAKAAKSLGKAIRARRLSSYKEQTEEYNGLLQAEDHNLVVRFGSQEGGSARRDVVAHLRGFFLEEPTPVEDDEPEEDFNLGIILSDAEGRLGTEPQGYSTWGTYIPSEPASWLSRRAWQ